MTRRRRHSYRQALIDACRLLGYTIEPAAKYLGGLKERRYVLVHPDGVVHHRRLVGEIPKLCTWKFMWEAAMEALIIEGVNVNALKPPRKARSSRSPKGKISGQRDQQGGDVAWLDEAAPLAGRDQ